MASSTPPPVPTPPTLTQEAQDVLTSLRDNHLVLISGPPGTGKSRLLAEIIDAFKFTPAPTHVPGAAVPIPAGGGGGLVPWLPSPSRTSRRAFPTVFDQSTKKRDFLRGLEPDVTPGGGGTQFRYSKGTLYRANEHARSQDGAALVVIDEINRGPAVAVFADSIVAIESDKRLDPNDAPTALTQTFEVADDTGAIQDYALSHHLYILAAMNEADTSVEPLDVAFLRRWSRYYLDPDAAVLENHFGLGGYAGGMPATATSAQDMYAAAVEAWKKVNARITLGRGEEYQIGHGVLMRQSAPPTASPQDAYAYLREGWTRVLAHVREVFFGDNRGIAATLADAYKVRRTEWAGQSVEELEGSKPTDAAELYKQMRDIAQST